MGNPIWDILFGSLATLIGAVGTYYLRKTKFLFTLPPVIANGLIIPFVLKYAYGLTDAFWFLIVTVAIGEVICVCVLGMILKAGLWPVRKHIFRNDDMA